MMAASSEARVPPSTAMIITLPQNEPPIRSPMNAKMFAAWSCISSIDATPWKARIATE